MAFDAFIWYDGVKGDSTDSSHKEWTEVKTFNQAVMQPTGGAASSTGTHAGGRADLATDPR